jgi:hypothetical protein
MRQSHPRDDRQCQEFSSCAGLTLYCQRNTSPHTGKSPQIRQNHYPGQYPQHLRVQAPSSNHIIPHTNDNRQIACSMRPQAPMPKVPTDILTIKPISVPLVTTTIEPRGKPTTMAAESSKRKRHCKRQATQLHKVCYSNQPNHTHKNSGTSGNSSSPSCTPFFEHMFTYTRQLGMPPPTCRPG